METWLDSAQCILDDFVVTEGKQKEAEIGVSVVASSLSYRWSSNEVGARKVRSPTNCGSGS